MEQLFAWRQHLASRYLPREVAGDFSIASRLARQVVPFIVAGEFAWLHYCVRQD
jgi:hypothetical protein